MLILIDKYLRNYYPDWPKEKNFIGEINFSKESISIEKPNLIKSIKLDTIKELIVFYDGYTGFSLGMRDIKRNGNSLIFIKINNDLTYTYKFNIYSEADFVTFKKYLNKIKPILPYFKEYTPKEIYIILNQDLSTRIKYN